MLAKSGSIENTSMAALAQRDERSFVEQPCFADDSDLNALGEAQTHFFVDEPLNLPADAADAGLSLVKPAPLEGPLQRFPLVPALFDTRQPPLDHLLEPF